MAYFPPTADRPHRMFRWGNIASRAMKFSLNALTVTAAIALATSSHPLRADEAPAVPPVPVAAGANTPPAIPSAVVPAKPAEAPLLDEAAGRNVYSMVEDWVAEGRVDLKTAPPPIWVSDVLAVNVTLRRVGYALGSGQAAVHFNPAAAPNDVPPSTTQVVDLAALAQTAAALALSDVESSLAESRLRALKENEVARVAHPEIPKLDPTDPRFQTLANLVSRGELLLDLQIARGAQNIALPANARFGAVYAQFMPGLHGLCMTRITKADNKTQQAWTWPASTLAMNEEPHSQLVELLHQLSFPRKDLETLIEQIARPAGPLLSRFAVLHLVRSNHDQPVTLLTRGNRVLPPGSVNGPMLEAMAQRLSAQLSRRVRENGSMAGTYQPSSDAWEPATASLADQAMAAYALGRRAAYLAGQPSAGRELRLVQDASRQAAGYLARQLLENREAAIQTDFPPAAALTLMTLVESPHLSDRKEQRNALAAQLLALHNSDGTFRSSLADNAGPIAAANQALVLCALSSLYEQTREPQLLSIIQQGQQLLWKAAKDDQLAVALPWVAILDLRMHRLVDKNDPAEPERWALVSKYLAALAKGYHDKQVPADSGAPDLAGGYELANDLIHGPPGPDWRTGYVLTFQAAYLRAVPSATPAQRAASVMECGEAARFLAQLMVDAPGCYYLRANDDALGGVRMKLWDNRVSTMSTAVGLLATVELQETLSVLAAAS